MILMKLKAIGAIRCIIYYGENSVFIVLAMGCGLKKPALSQTHDHLSGLAVWVADHFPEICAIN